MYSDGTLLAVDILQLGDHKAVDYFILAANWKPLIPTTRYQVSVTFDNRPASTYWGIVTPWGVNPKLTGFEIHAPDADQTLAQLARARTMSVSYNGVEIFRVQLTDETPRAIGELKQCNREQKGS